jgi:hypothetical protein
MLILHATTDIIRVVTGSAADVEPTVSAMETDNSVPPVVQDIPNIGPLASITTATTTTIADCTTANRRRNIKHISLYNNHASTSTTCRVEFSDGSVSAVLANCTLLAGEMLVFTQGGIWIHYDSNGAPYPSVGNAASQAEMEAGTATDKYVTPQGVNWHPGACKAWGKAVGAGTSLTVNWNIASIADTGTGRLGVTIGTDFSSANYAIDAMVERSVTSLTATGVEDQTIRNASPTAGVFEIESYDQTAILFAAQDPANYFWSCFGDQA